MGWVFVRSRMKDRMLLIVVLLFLLSGPVSAFQCLAENDCPACSIDGATITRKSLNSGYSDKQVLTCEYSGKNDNIGKVTLSITCFDNAGIARQWTDYYAGTGQNPDKSSAGLSGRPRWRCVSGGSVKGSGQTMIESFGCGDFTGTGRFVATIDADGTAGYLSSDPVAEENRKVSAAQDVVKTRIQKYKDCFAGFSPGAIPSPQEKTLHGTVIATKLPYGIEYPLKHAKLTLSESFAGGERRELGKTTTDDEGNYEFRGLAETGKAYEIATELTYTNQKEYFSIFHGSAESANNKVVLPYSFTIRDDKDLEQNIDLDTLWSELGMGGENPYGIIYVHTAEALEFYRDELHEDINLNLPVRIIAFVPDTTFRKDIRAMYYFEPDSGLSAIVVSNKESGPRSEYRPVNREYHEFSHYMMTNTYGRYLDSRVKNATPVINHDGYVNPGTSDSWQEGFATFVSVLIAEDYGYSCDGTGGFVNLDSSYRAWQYQGKAEEFAVAGVLYDLYDGEAQKKACGERSSYLVGRMANSPYLSDYHREMASYIFTRMTEKQPGPDTREVYRDDDNISLPLREIWAVLKNRHPDFTSVYHGFVERYPEKKGEIDAVFLDHGFFIDRDPGNGNYDPSEPFRDANGNAVYDPGELYTDMPSMGSNTGEPVFDRLTETIGTAANYDRPWRLSTQQLPGHFIRVNNAVPFFGYTVEFPTTSRAPYKGLARNNDGLIYVPVPPEPGAKITVRAVGVTTGNPLVFTSDQFHENYLAAVKQGYYISHDFRISGPVPTPPVTPGFSKGSPAGMKNTGFPDILSPSSRIPLIVSIPIAIAALLVLAYVLKKGE
jgi:hypothetical protein